MDCIDIPGSLDLAKDKFHQEHLCIEVSKLQLKDAIVYYDQLLAQNFYRTSVLEQTRLYLLPKGLIRIDEKKLLALTVRFKPLISRLVDPSATQ